MIPALLRKAHVAKAEKLSEMTIWGTGKPRREFLYVEDCADALVHILKFYSDDEHINVGSGEDIPIALLAEEIMSVVGFEGALEKDSSKPDGTPRKLMSGQKLKDLGWSPSVSLREGLRETYKWFLEHENSLREA